MKKLRIYLDNCCYNRPFDDQSSFLVRMETDAKLHVQEFVRVGEIELVWSFVLDYENGANPFEEIRGGIAEWRMLACVDVLLTDEVAKKAHELMELGLRQKDAAHVACAIYAKADFFLTTDKKILNKSIEGVTVINPIDFLRRYLDAE
jgi:predicted nucleic acid-binding protein